MNGRRKKNCSGGNFAAAIRVKELPKKLKSSAIFDLFPFKSELVVARYEIAFLRAESFISTQTTCTTNFVAHSFETGAFEQRHELRKTRA